MNFRGTGGRSLERHAGVGSDHERDSRQGSRDNSSQSISPGVCHGVDLLDQKS